MKKILFTLLFMLIAFGVFSQKTVKLQVVYFHAKYRCPTCVSIEDNTKKTLNTYFASLMKNGTITLQVLDVSDGKNQKLVEKYQADGSGLYLTGFTGTKEVTTNLTNFAFSYSRNQPAKFIAGLKSEIEKKLR